MGKEFDWYEAVGDGLLWDICYGCGEKFEVVGKAFGAGSTICPSCAIWEEQEASRRYDEDENRRRR